MKDNNPNFPRLFLTVVSQEERSKNHSEKGSSSSHSVRQVIKNSRVLKNRYTFRVQNSVIRYQIYPNPDQKCVSNIFYLTKRADTSQACQTDLENVLLGPVGFGSVPGDQ